MRVEILVIGAHPDDADLGVGGAMAKFARQGARVGILDLTRGERATRGSVEERREEARRAAETLGVSIRENAELPDGGLADISDQRERVAECIRRLTPQVILAPMAPDRHPDHTAAHALIHAANFTAGLSSFQSDHAPHRAAHLYHYYSYTEAQTIPPLVVDISDTFETKLEALRQYRSQFFNPEYQGGATLVASESFWQGITTRAAYWGHRIGAAYGEPLFAPLPLKINSLPPFLSGYPEQVPGKQEVSP